MAIGLCAVEIKVAKTEALLPRYSCWSKDTTKALALNLAFADILLVKKWEDYDNSSSRFYVKNRSNGFVPMQYEELS